MKSSNHQVTKKEYFEAAAEYFRITAENISLEESQADGALDAIRQNKSKRFLHMCVMQDYSDGVTRDIYELLYYPQLSKDKAAREIRANKKLASVKSEVTREIKTFLAPAILSPAIVRAIDGNIYGLWKTLLYALAFLPGLIVAYWGVCSLIAYPVRKKTERLEFSSLEEREAYLKHSSLHIWLSIAASVAIGFAIYAAVHALAK